MAGEHRIALSWTDGGRPFTYDTYPREHTVTFKTGQAVTVSASPAYKGDGVHADPEDRYSVVSFVWGPGQKTPVHNHTVWALIGMMRGSERGERFSVPEAGQPMRLLGEDTLEPGDIDMVSPRLGDIHRVSNAFDDRVSISIHVYGGNIGRISRHVFDIANGTTKDFVSGYSNEQAKTAG